MNGNTAQKDNNRLKSIAQVLIAIICAVIFASVITGAVFDTTRISGRSMDDTLYGGKSGDPHYDAGHFDVIPQNTFFDRFFFGGADTFGDKVLLLRTKKVSRGDIVVFMSDYEIRGVYQQWIKRVIGVAGDNVRISGGKVYLNGEELCEDYATGATAPYVGSEETWTVGENEIFVLGDNRENSTDSRVIGCVDAADIVGRVLLVFKRDTKKIVGAKNL